MISLAFHPCKGKDFYAFARIWSNGVILMLAITKSLVLQGIRATAVQVEVDIQNGLPAFVIVGLASAAVKEAGERVRSALKNSGYSFPNRKITVNLAPADLKKEGTQVDLAIAVGILAASEQINWPNPEHCFLTAELSLDGSLHPVPGILSMALELAERDQKATLIVAPENQSEAALIHEITAYYAPSLREVGQYFDEGQDLMPVQPQLVTAITNRDQDFSDVKGQTMAKKALLVAASGMHNMLMIGPPGSGKTMLAQRLPDILPEMNREEALETSRIYSVAGLLNQQNSLIQQRPFRAPHRNASATSIIGGGRIPRPGEISLAHNGVLFLDEAPEFSREVLESLRQPLEDRIVTIARTAATHQYPANFMLVASMNPCPCGFYGSEVECRCSQLQISRYLSRLSGPLLDRLDLQVEVSRIEYEQLNHRFPAESTAEMRERVATAHEIQLRRFVDSSFSFNAQMRRADLQRWCALDDDSSQLFRQAFQLYQMSARAHDRILKIARTIADIDQSDAILLPHMAEALQYRSLDKKYWR